MKKWQKAFVNHIEAIRNTDSPLNGSRISSPQFNGAIRDSSSLPGTPTLPEGLEKLKNVEGKKRGLKRKRGGSTSSESSPVVFGKLLEKDLNSRSGTPTTEGVDSALSSPGSIVGSTVSLSQSQTEICTPTSLFSNDCEQSSTSVSTQNAKDAIVEPETEKPKLGGNISDNKNGEMTECARDCGTRLADTTDGSVVKDKPHADDSCNIDVMKPKTNSDVDIVTSLDIKENAVETSECAEELVGLDEDSPESYLPPLRPPKSPSEMELEVSAQARGINGHFGADGVWYDWTEVMPSSEGSLNILPYVLLE